MALDELEIKATPDEGTLAASEFESLAGQKVQLDIDDAPFLLDPDDEPEAPATISENLPAPPTKDGGRKKKLIMIIAAALVLLMAGGGAAWYFLFRSPPPAVPVEQPPVIVVPSRKEESTLPKEYTTRLEPFWVPLTDTKGARRFLVATFVLSTEDGRIHDETQDKLVTVRDAIFYYLVNKDYDFLMNPDNAETLRTDLLSTINNYIVQGELENLYFDSFLLQ